MSCSEFKHQKVRGTVRVVYLNFFGIYKMPNDDQMYACAGDALQWKKMIFLTFVD